MNGPGADPSARPAGAAGLLAGGLALVLFALSAHHVVGADDVAEFQTLAATGGIAHAGYPALVMLLEAFGRLPVATVAFRANLLSACAGAVVVGAAAWAGTRLTGRMSAGVFAALGLALSITVWRESSRAEVYAFTLAIAVFAFLLTVRLATRPGVAGAFTLGLLGGLGLVSHLTILALLPVVVAAVVMAARSGRLRLRHLSLATLGLLVGLLPLGYLLAHDRPDQSMNYIHDTLRPDNAEELSGGSPPVGRVARTAWLMSGRQFLGGFAFSPFADLANRLRLLVTDSVLNQFPVWGIPLALYGAVVLWRRREPMGLFLLLWLGGTVFWLLYGATANVVTVFFLPGLWVASQLVAAALGDLGRHDRRLPVLVGALVAVTSLARVSIAEPPGPIARAGVLRAAWLEAPAQWSPWRADSSWDVYGRGVMGALAPRAVVLACWEEATTLRYFRFGEVLRDDVDVLYHCRIPGPAFAAADSAGRPLYTTYPLTEEMTGGRRFHEVGRWTRGALWRIEAPVVREVAAAR